MHARSCSSHSSPVSVSYEEQLRQPFHVQSCHAHLAPYVVGVHEIRDGHNRRTLQGRHPLVVRRLPSTCTFLPPPKFSVCASLGASWVWVVVVGLRIGVWPHIR